MAKNHFYGFGIPALVIFFAFLQDVKNGLVLACTFEFLLQFCTLCQSLLSFVDIIFVYLALPFIRCCMKTGDKSKTYENPHDFSTLHIIHMFLGILRNILSLKNLHGINLLK